MSQIQEVIDGENLGLPSHDPSSQDRFHALEQQVTYLTQQLQISHQTQPPPPPSPPPHHPNLNLPTPPYFSGVPSELVVFRLKLNQYILGNPNTYTDSASQVLFAGALLTGSAGQWHASLVDPVTSMLPPHYTLAFFLQALESFFGGGATLDSRERSLTLLRQTGTVAELAIAFQTITNTFIPRWPDHPLIYLFSQKLKEPIRFQLTSQGSLSPIFQEYVAAAAAVEHNQSAASLSRSHAQPQIQPPRNPPPRLPLPPPATPVFPLPGHDPMDLDGSRGRRGPLTIEERRRRSDAGLCAYCGTAGHVLATCPRAAHIRQARGTY